jgi:hypothetical protein
MSSGNHEDVAKQVDFPTISNPASEASPPFQAGLPGKEEKHFCIAPLDPALPGGACGEHAGQKRPPHQLVFLPFAFDQESKADPALFPQIPKARQLTSNGRPLSFLTYSIRPDPEVT